MASARGRGPGAGPTSAARARSAAAAARAGAIAANSSRAQPSLPCSVQVVREGVAQLDQHLDVERGVAQPRLGERPGGPVGGASAPSPGEAEHASRRAAPGRPGGSPASRPASSVSKSVVGAHADLGQARQVLAGARAAPTRRPAARCPELGQVAGSRPGRPARCRRRPGAAGRGRRAGRSGSRTPARRRPPPARRPRRGPRPCAPGHRRGHGRRQPVAGLEERDRRGPLVALLGRGLVDGLGGTGAAPAAATSPAPRERGWERHRERHRRPHPRRSRPTTADQTSDPRHSRGEPTGQADPHRAPPEMIKELSTLPGQERVGCSLINGDAAGYSMTPARSARATISARSPVPSLRAMRARWLFTVSADRCSDSPMSRLE